MQNFPFEYKGKTYWWSRSMTGVNYIFCFNHAINEWCVLASQRGPGCPTAVGKYCVPCGYTDCNETVKETAIRETYEETGIICPDKEVNFLFLRTNPHSKTQNYDCSFYTVLKDDVSLHPVSNANNEPNETSEIVWIPMSKIDKYDFAFEQAPVIKTVYKKYVNISWFRKIMLKLTDYLYSKFKNPILV